jgi:hypothetical protein
MGATDKIRGKIDTDGSRKLTEIGLLLYPGAQTSAVTGLTDLFVVAQLPLYQQPIRRASSRP